MPGLALLRWFSGAKPAVPSHKRGPGNRPKVAAPPSVGLGSAGVICPSPEDSHDGSQQPQHVAGGPVPAHLLGHLARLHLLVRAVALPSLHLAGRLLAKPWEPIQDQVQQQLASMQAVKDACRALHVDTLQDLQDVLGSLILSECVYKVLDMEDFRAVQAINNLKAFFPPQLVTLRRVQWALPHAQHSFLMAESADALFVAFMGTKRPRDMVTNVNVWQDQILFDAAASGDTADATPAAAGTGASTGSTGPGAGAAPAAHRGFSSRARAIPIEALYQQARARGKRLVLCGHSLGGAVAQLCAVRLLQQLPPAAHSTVSCIGFATPPVGNQALAELVAQNEWSRRLRNYLLPEDPIPRLLASRQPAVTAEDTAPEAPQERQLATAVGTLAEPPAAVALASVSLHSDALSGEGRRARRGPRLPSLGKAAFWVRHSPPSSPRAEQRGGEAGGCSRGSGGALGAEQHGASHSGAVAAAVDVAVVAGAQQEPASAAPGLANNITAAPQLGILRISRLAAHVAPERPTNQSGIGGDGSMAEPNAAFGGEGGAAAEAAALEVPAGQLAEAGAEEPADASASAGSLSSVLDSVDSAGSGLEPSQPKKRQGRWRVPRPPLPLEAMAQSAQAAARLVTLPLSVAASVPGRVAPQYYDLAQTLFVLPDAVTTNRPKPAQRKGGGGSRGKRERAAVPVPVLPRSRTAGALPALSATGDSHHVVAPGGQPGLRAAAASSPVLLQQPAGEGGSSDEGDLEDDAATVAQAVATAAAAAQEGVNVLTPMQLPPRTLFPMHRMLSYRNRILSIVAGSLKGRVWLPALPHVGNFPHPDDVSLSLLLAPGLFPLKAEAAVSLGAGGSGTQPAAAAARPASPAGPHRKIASAAEPAGASVDGGELAAAGGPRAATRRHRRRWSLLRIFGRPGGQFEGAPLELEVRVEGKGLHTVTRAWLETGLPTQPRERGSDGTGVMPAQIVWQPACPTPAAVHGNPLTAITPVSSFFSWLAVSFGWVHLLRRLQPAGKQDYLVARVAVPASLVQQAQLAASNPLQAAVNDAHLPGVRVGPKLVMHLQSDFARTSVPLDIRAAADVDSQLAGLGWRQFMPRKWWE